MSGEPLRSHNLRLSLLTVILLIAVLFFQYRLWFEAGGIVELMQYKHNLGLQLAENDQLRKNNDELIAQIKRLQNSEDAIESRARSELGMVKKDETYYQIIK
jgi:cell division protein FtsB